MKTAPFVSAVLLSSLGLPGSLRADSVVVLNEVMYHPAGNRADLEWIEVANVMSTDVDISGWALDGAVHFEFPEGTVISRGGFLVIAASPEALASEGDHAEALGPFEARLDNSGDRIDLRNNSWRLMDSADYNDSGNWPVAPDGSGVSLAKRIPDSASDRSSSWVASALPGGTPGRANFQTPGTPPPLPRDLVSYWSFDQSGGQALDLAGGNNGTLGAGVTRVAGITGSHAVSFSNGGTAYVNVGAGAGNAFSFTTGITIEALLQPGWNGVEGDQDAIFRKDDGTNRLLLSFQNDGANGEANPPTGPGPVLSFGLTIGGSYSELDMLLDGASGRPSLASLVDGNAHHVAAVYDGTTGRKAIFVDGALASSVDLPPGGSISSGGTTHAYIGNAPRRTDPFTGVIDEVAIWKKALTAEDVARHASLAREGKTYFHAEEEPPGPPLPTLEFNEILSPVGAGFWVEVLNEGAASADLTGCVVGSSQDASEYVFPSRTMEPGGFLVLTELELGFRPLAGRNLFVFSPDRKAVLAAARVEDGLRGRHPDGKGPWLHPGKATPGAPNAFVFHDELVINEIMYHPRLIEEDGVPREPAGAWVEIFHRGVAAVDMTGWKLGGGIDFDFADGTTLAPGEYLVVAEDKDYLQALHPGIRIEGNFTRRLSRKGDLILLLDENGNPADEVRYLDGGRWPELADGGGSSLELRDPGADNSAAEAWAASDEAAASSWVSYSYEAVAGNTVGPTRWNEFVMGLLDAGEALIDDLSVIETPETAPKEFLQDGKFDRGAATWRLLGNHRASEAIPDPDDPSGQVLHLVASGPTEHMHNHAETTLAGGARVTTGRRYRVSFRAKWLGGSNRLNTRLYFNRCAMTTLLDVPPRNGTPGARNSRLEENIGPTFSGLRHSPPVPAANEEVAVAVEAADPDGVRSIALRWSVNAGVWMTAPMEARPDGGFEAKIPGQPAGALVQFHVEAEDGQGAVASCPAGGPDSRALYRVQDGQAVLGRVHNLRILMTAADTNLLHLDTNVMSNERLGATIVVDEKDVFYDCGVRLKGSERGRIVNERVGFNIKFPPDRLFRGVHESVQVDRSGGWKFGRQFGQDEIVIKHVASRAGGIPAMYDDVIRVIAPRSAHTSSALLIMAGYGDAFLDSQYEGGGDGTAYEFELIYSPTTTTNGSPEGLKRPQPDDVLGTDIRDLGNDRESYRWNFLIENNRARDDYGPLMALGKAFSLPANQLEAGTRAAMDVEQWMRAFTIYSLCGVGDAYTQGNNHNLVLYARPGDGKVLAFPWDMDFAFTQATSAPLSGDQGLARIIQIPSNRRLFYCHLLDVMDRAFNAEYMGRWVSHYGSLCGQDFSSITSYITQRKNFVTQSIPARVPFAITTNGGQDFAVEGASTVLEGTAWFDVKEIYPSGAQEPLVLSWTAPTRWRAEVELQDGPNRIEILATDLRGLPLATAAVTVTASIPIFIRGDADLDGGVSIVDAVRILRHLFEGSADLGCEDAADADDNELLNLTDAIRILAYLFLDALPLSPPHPEPGPDPTRGALGCAGGLTQHL